MNAGRPRPSATSPRARDFDVDSATLQHASRSAQQSPKSKHPASQQHCGVPVVHVASPVHGMPWQVCSPSDGSPHCIPGVGAGGETGPGDGGESGPGPGGVIPFGEGGKILTGGGGKHAG
jgi:hypothetical protein